MKPNPAGNTCDKKKCKEGFTYHFELLSCLTKCQRGTTSSCCKCPSCPLLLQSLKALPFDPIFLVISNSSPMSTSNKHSWYPFTTQHIVTLTSSLTSLLFCFERGVADILNDIYPQLFRLWIATRGILLGDVMVADRRTG